MRRSLALAGAAVLATGLTFGGAGMALAAPSPAGPDSTQCLALQDQAASADQRATNLQQRADNQDARATNLQQRASNQDAKATEQDGIAAENDVPDATQEQIDARDAARKAAAAARQARDDARADAQAALDARDDARVAVTAAISVRDQARADAQVVCSEPEPTPTEEPTTPPPSDTPAPPFVQPGAVVNDPNGDGITVASVRAEIDALSCDGFNAQVGRIADHEAALFGEATSEQLGGLYDAETAKLSSLNYCVGTSGALPAPVDTNKVIDLTDDDDSVAATSGTQVREVPEGSVNTGGV